MTTLLPSKIGPFTLMRRLGTDGVVESFVAILDDPPGKQVVVHRLLPWVCRNSARLSAAEARIQDLLGIRHASLVSLLGYTVVGEDRFLLEEWVDGVDLARILAHCKRQKERLPPNLFLHLATHICNGLEGLHGRPGTASSVEHVVHLGLSPTAIALPADGRVLLRGYGIARSPMLPAISGDEPLHEELTALRAAPLALGYLSPEQTHSEQKATPASDVFSLGALLYEMVTLEPLFVGSTPAEIVQQVRRGEITSALLRVKEVIPGLDKVLYRALSANPRHRYQRAFVFREDLRGLMSGYSFATITDDLRAFLAPHIVATPSIPPQVAPLSGDAEQPPAADDTASLIRKAAAKKSRTKKKAPISASEVPPAPTLEPAPLRLTNPQPPIPVAPTIELPEAETEPSAYKPAAASPATLTPDDPSEDTHTEEKVVPVPAPPPPRAPVSVSSANSAVKTSWIRSEAPPAQSDVLAEAATPVLPAGPRWGRIIGAMAGLAGLALIGLCAGGAWFVLHASAPEGTESAAISRTTPSVPVKPVPSPTPPPTEPLTPLPPPTPLPSVPDVEPWASQSPPSVALAEPEPSRASGTRGTHVSTTPPKKETKQTPAALRAFDLAPAPVKPPPEPTGLIVSEPRIVPAAPPTNPSANPAPVPVDFAALSTRAHKGQLGQEEKQSLEAYGADSPDYGRAQVLLYEDAKGRGDNTGRQWYLTAIMRIPENQYNPALLAEESAFAIEHQQWRVALERANRAEQHWARLPSELIFTRKAMIYELQAASWQGLFYESGGSDLVALKNAIRSWEKYQRHVDTQARSELSMRASEQLAKLHDIERRVE